jgi:hypothetical protein
MIGERGRENRTSNAVAGVHRGTGSLSPIRRRREADCLSSTLHTCAPRTSLQKEVCRESEATRPKTEGQAIGLGPRFPRQGLVDGFRFSSLTGEFRIGQPLADDLTDTDVKPLGISHLAIVKPERLLVDVAEQVERFHTDIGPVQATLQQTPEIFHAVGVSIFVSVFNRVIDDGMLVILRQAVIRKQLVGEDRCASLDVLAYLLLKFSLATTIYNMSGLGAITASMKVKS